MLSWPQAQGHQWQDDQDHCRALELLSNPANVYSHGKELSSCGEVETREYSDETIQAGTEQAFTGTEDIGEAGIVLAGMSKARGSISSPRCRGSHVPLRAGPVCWIREPHCPEKPLFPAQPLCLQFLPCLHILRGRERRRRAGLLPHQGPVPQLCPISLMIFIHLFKENRVGASWRKPSGDCCPWLPGVAEAAPRCVTGWQRGALR